MLARFKLFAVVVAIICTPGSAAGDEPWVLLEYQSEGYPVVMKVMEKAPAKSVRDRFTWLTVVSWRYDREDNNGMPLAETNKQMVALENAIDDIEENGLCVQVYTKTGNGLKELVYYINDREAFMKAFNDVLEDHPRYPLGIEFFEDPEWSDLQTVHKVYLQKE